MSIRKRLAVALLATVPLALVLEAQVRGAAAGDGLTVAIPAALGSADRCAAYSGLPAQWQVSRTAGMKALRGGRFMLGTTLGYPDERPAAAETAVAAFWIDETEVTNAQFASFVAATGYRTGAEVQGGGAVFHVPTGAEPKARPNAWWTWVQGADWRHPHGPASTLAGLDNQPVTLVTETDALAYAHWLGRELPTEAEWEFAAKGGAAKAGVVSAELDKAPRDAAGHPSANYWQGAFPVVDTAADGHAGLAPVGCYAANAFGLYDMIGNAWEWTRDTYTGAHQSHVNGDPAIAAAAAGQVLADAPIVIKGGSFLCSPDFCVRYRASAREAQEADVPASHIGFRTVLRNG